jgi:hypothetical protein
MMAVLRIHAHSIDNAADPNPAGERQDGFHRVFVLEIHRFCTLPADHVEPILQPVDGDHTCTHDLRRGDGELPDGTAAEDGD